MTLALNRLTFIVVPTVSMVLWTIGSHGRGERRVGCVRVKEELRGEGEKKGRVKKSLNHKSYFFYSSHDRFFHIAIDNPSSGGSWGAPDALLGVSWLFVGD